MKLIDEYKKKPLIIRILFILIIISMICTVLNFNETTASISSILIASMILIELALWFFKKEK